MKYMKMQSDLCAKCTLITCNSLINVVFNNTLANNSKKQCLIKVYLEHDLCGWLSISICTSSLMIFLFYLWQLVTRTLPSGHFTKYVCSSDAMFVVLRLLRSFTKKSLLRNHMSSQQICVRQMYHSEFIIFLLHLRTLTLSSNIYFTSDSMVAIVSLTTSHPKHMEI